MVKDMMDQIIVYELKNGKGYVKEYNWKGELKFEGELINGIRNENGKNIIFIIIQNLKANI